MCGLCLEQGFVYRFVTEGFDAVEKADPEFPHYWFEFSNDWVAIIERFKKQPDSALDNRVLWARLFITCFEKPLSERQRALWNHLSEDLAGDLPEYPTLSFQLDEASQKSRSGSRLTSVSKGLIIRPCLPRRPLCWSAIFCVPISVSPCLIAWVSTVVGNLAIRSMAKIEIYSWILAGMSFVTGCLPALCCLPGRQKAALSNVLPLPRLTMWWIFSRWNTDCSVGCCSFAIA